MLLKGFVEKLVEVAPYTDSETRKSLEPGLASVSPLRGISCQLCLTPDGHVSSEETAITLSFTIHHRLTD